MSSFDFKTAFKWLLNFVLIGMIAGLGAVLFHYLCGLGMHYFLDMMA
jgi:CIC family chloride channel protein